MQYDTRAPGMTKAQHMEIVWQSTGTTPRKRTFRDNLSPPCRSCQIRKKKCYHCDDGREDDAARSRPVQAAKQASPPQRRHNHQQQRQPLPLPRPPQVQSLSTVTRESSPSPAPTRVGPYNPEAVLSGLMPQTEDRHIGQSQSHGRLAWYKRNKERKDPKSPALTPAHRAYLEEAGAFLTLPIRTTQALLPLYVSILDDLIPVVDGAKLSRDHSNGTASDLLVRAVCLVVCKSPQAAPFLWLQDEGEEPLEPLAFATTLRAGLDAALKANLEPDRVTRVRILALMHLHTDGPGALDRSLCYLTQAITEAWCLSLHHSRANTAVRKPPATTADAAADDYDYDLLWWTLRHLDRLNKPITGAAPFVIDDSNVGIPRITIDQMANQQHHHHQHSCYRSELVHIATILGDLMVPATRAYKPRIAKAEDVCHEFPPLEQLVSGTNFHAFHRAHRAYFEIWYHVAAMLSCRFSGPGTVHYARRLDSADRILEILARRHHNLGDGGGGGAERGGGEIDHNLLPPLPLIPYAMSTSTTVIYRALRDGKRDVQAARADLLVCLEALDELARCWTSVRGIARLTRKICDSLSSTTAVAPDIAQPALTKESRMGTMPNNYERVEVLMNRGIPIPDAHLGHNMAEMSNAGTTMVPVTATRPGGIPIIPSGAAPGLIMRPPMAETAATAADVAGLHNPTLLPASTGGPVSNASEGPLPQWLMDELWAADMDPSSSFSLDPTCQGPLGFDSMNVFYYGAATSLDFGRR